MAEMTLLELLRVRTWIQVCVLLVLGFTIPFLAFFALRLLLLDVLPTLWTFYYPLATTPTNLFLLLNLIIFTLFAMSHAPRQPTKSRYASHAHDTLSPTELPSPLPPPSSSPPSSALSPAHSQSPRAFALSSSVALASSASPINSGDHYYRRLFDQSVVDNYSVASPVRHLRFEDPDILAHAWTDDKPSAPAHDPIPAPMSGSISSAAINGDESHDDARHLVGPKAHSLGRKTGLALDDDDDDDDDYDDGSCLTDGSDPRRGSYSNYESAASSEASSPLVNVNEGDEEEEDQGQMDSPHPKSISRPTSSRERPLAASRFTHRGSPTKSGIAHSPLGPHNSRSRTSVKRQGQTLEATWRAICEEKKSMKTHSSLLRSNSRHIILQRADKSTGSSSSNNSPTSLKAKTREPSMRADELHARIEAFISRFNDQIRIQREQSILNYMETVTQGAK